MLGVDGCPGGWVGVVLSSSAPVAVTATSLAALVSAVGPVDCVAVDIPLGLPDTSRRQCDELVRRKLGGRGVTVFDAAVRSAYEACTHALASAAHKRLTGRGLSVQAWNLGPRVLDAVRFATCAAVPVIEAHPELSFAVMGSGSPAPPKKTAEGVGQRRALLASQGIAVPAVPVPARMDDVLDACGVAWTARRHILGAAVSYPSPPELFSDGVPAAIWV